MDKFVSIIMTHYGQNKFRSSAMKASLKSLWDSTEYPFELIVVDNGPDIGDSKWLLDKVAEGKINTYIRNAKNMHFGYARSQALELAQGDYICIIDNDISFNNGWLTECVKILEANPDEPWYATPIDYPQTGYLDNIRYRQSTFEYDGKTYSLNMRAGSNCFVMRRDRFREVGKFHVHRIAGTKWTDMAVRKGYVAVVLPEGYAGHIALRRGYNLATALPVSIKLSDGKEVYFNKDEHTDCGDYHIQQRSFNS